MEKLVNLALLFFVYSFAGWLIEVTLKYIQYHRFINRGFFTGPILPIYGSGAALITVAIEYLSPFESGYVTTFAISFVLCGLVEYLSSYFMEKRFHARWWDYSQKPMNLNGRVWIGNLALFGLGGVAIVHILNPLLYRGLGLVSLEARQIAAVAFLAVFAADYVATHFVLKLVKTGVEKSKADNTEEINKEVRLLLSDRSIFYRRFADAYPDVVYTTERIKERMAQIRVETERLRRDAEQLLAEQKQQLAARVEPAALIKNTIIDRQGQLIHLMYDEQSATEEMRALYTQIEADKDRLAARPLARLMKS